MWQGIFGRAASGLTGPIRDERGAVAVYAALALPVLLGSIGLGVDVGLAYTNRQAAQVQADAAAMAAVLELADGSDLTTVVAAGKADAARNGFVQTTGATIEIHTPPESGSFVGDETAAEVRITRAVHLTFARFVGGPSDMTITARAVARHLRTEACVWALEEAETGVSLTGKAEVSLDCGVYARSVASQAIDVDGTSCLTATSVVVAGGTDGACIKPTPRSNVAALDDPLSMQPPPTTDTACPTKGKTSKTKISNATTTLKPGFYCDGIEISGNSKVTFEQGDYVISSLDISGNSKVIFGPGTYVIRGGTFSSSGNSILSGTEVTFYLTTDGKKYAEVKLPSTNVQFTAPTSGPNKGILFYQDREAPTVKHEITGGSGVSMTGTIYLPTSELKFSGGSGSSGTASFLIARTIRFNGNSSLSAGGGSTTTPSGLTRASLVE